MLRLKDEEALHGDPQALASELVAMIDGSEDRLRLATVASQLMDAQRSLPTASDSDGRKAERAAVAAATLHSVVEHCVAIAAPDMIQRALAQVSVGKAVAFAPLVRAYLSPAEAAGVLRDVATRPKSLRGALVAADEGLIYRLPTRGVSSVLRVVGPIVFWIAALAALIFAGAAVVPDGKHLGYTRDFAHGVGLVFGGVAAHWAASAYKDGSVERLASHVPVAADWGKWWVLHPLAPLALLAAPAITVGALVVIDADFSTTQGTTLFVLAGYSADSIARSAIDRLDELSSQTAKAILPKSKPAE